MISLVIRYVVSVVWYEPFIYGQEQPSVWFKDVGQVRKKHPDVGQVRKFAPLS